MLVLIDYPLLLELVLRLGRSLKRVSLLLSLLKIPLHFVDHEILDFKASIVPSSTASPAENLNESIVLCRVTSIIQVPHSHIVLLLNDDGREFILIATTLPLVGLAQLFFVKPVSWWGYVIERTFLSLLFITLAGALIGLRRSWCINLHHLSIVQLHQVFIALGITLVWFAVQLVVTEFRLLKLSLAEVTLPEHTLLELEHCQLIVLLHLFFVHGEHQDWLSDQLYLNLLRWSHFLDLPLQTVEEASEEPSVR